MIQFHNTLSGQKEEFKPINPGAVGMYNCGPTVYNYAHVGNLRSYVFADVLKRALKYNGFDVKQIINITDVGHLVSDADTGEDKVEKASRESNKNPKEITEFYTTEFLKDLAALNIDTEGTLFPRATDHIKEQIDLINILQEKGFTYKTSDGVYFDTAKFSHYGKLGNIDIEGLKEGARIEANPEKRNITDFALWKFSKPEEKRLQEWDSPFGKGFPGWHIECSAMSMKYLGETFDIHTGGIDHIPIHHNNEIAQSESATGKKYADYWMHNAFINVQDGKMAKSAGNFLRLQSFVDKNIEPLAYRYWLLGANYQTPMTFSFEALEGAQNAYLKLKSIVAELPEGGSIVEAYKTAYEEKINNNLDTPNALALVWQLLKEDSVTPEDKKATILDFDRVLGLKLGEKKEEHIPDDVRMLAEKREDARKFKDFHSADELRIQIEKHGFTVKDTENGYKLKRI